MRTLCACFCCLGVVDDSQGSRRRDSIVVVDDEVDDALLAHGDACHPLLVLPLNIHRVLGPCNGGGQGMAGHLDCGADVDGTDCDAAAAADR